MTRWIFEIVFRSGSASAIVNGSTIIEDTRLGLPRLADGPSFRKHHVSLTTPDRVPYYGSVSCTFRDFQDDSNPFNGMVLDSQSGLSELLESFRGRQPFLFELREDPGFTLTIGFSCECGCVQYARSDGEPPYEMAVRGLASEEDEKSVWFLAGDQPTEIDAKFCLSIEQIRSIATQFVVSGGKSQTVGWEEV